ncbi:MAG: hypothetical protein LBQ09_11970 [Acidobacteriaceae bacterium]|nr:hypothetical protein [Acidobacteriaceae bacterium]
MAAALGAVAGGVAGYFLLTEKGQQSLRSVRPRLDALAHELGGVQRSLHGVTDAARSGWQLLDEFVSHTNEHRSRSSVTH